MVETATKPVEVSASQGLIDVLGAAGRLLAVIVATVPLLLAALGTRNVVEIIAFFQSNEGVKLIAAVSGLVALGWGLYKTHKRGAQLVSVGADSRVPDAVVKITD